MRPLAAPEKMLRRVISDGGPRGAEKLWTVQLLRALAATMVVVGHSQSAVGRVAMEQGWAFHRWDVMPWGASVDLFFVISGFIMVHASRGLFARPSGRAEFLSRRLARVVPFYWFCTSLYVALLLWAAAKGGKAPPALDWIAASYLFLPVTAPGGGIFPVFDLGWTLNYEMGFYLVFLLFLGLERRRAILAIGVALAGIVAAGVLFDPDFAPLRFWTRPIIVDFALGMIVGIASVTGTRLPGWTRVAMIVFGAAVFVADPLQTFTVPLGATVDNGWPRVALAGVPATLVLAGALLGGEPAMPRWVQPGVFIGNASYSLYLSHPFVLIVMEKLVQKLPAAADATPPPVIVTGCVLVSLALTVACYRWVERPMTQGADRALKRLRGAIASPSVIAGTVAEPKGTPS